MDELTRAPWYPTLSRRRTTSADGTGIYYEALGQGTHTLLLANGLGGRLYSWQPIIDRFHTTHRLLTWDYRGLFESDRPPAARRLAVSHHVEDAAAILDAEGVDRAVILGWSMGVQVALDVAAYHPERVAGLVLLNGTYGHTMTTGFQPFFEVPWLPKRLHSVAEVVRGRPAIRKAVARLARMSELPTLAVLSLTAGRRSFSMRPILRRYLDDVLGDSFDNFMRLFQELDAHSVYHLLPEIDTPALVVSGALDILTPARQSREIARRMPNAERLALTRCSHFAMLERPEKVLPAIERFLTRRAHW